MRFHVQKSTITAVAIAVLLVGVYVYWGSRPPTRPSSVAANAVYVRGAKTGWWQTCDRNNRGEVFCTISNAGGVVIQEGKFLPYDGGVSPAQEELCIDASHRWTGPDRICLRNGRILIPESRYADLKQFLDRLTR